MNQPTLPDQLLTELCSHHLGVSPSALTISRCPTGKHNDTYFVEGAPRPVVLRVAPPDDPWPMLFYEYRMMRQEPALHALIRARTDVPVPEILAHDFSHRLVDRDYLLRERLPGRPLSDVALSSRELADVLREVGRCLRQVHALTGAAFGYVGEHHVMEPQPDWPGAFTIMWDRLLTDIERCGGYTADEARYLRRLLAQHYGTFDRPVAASLLHMDVWAQNILVEEGRLTGLLDWDRALWGDPEIDFAVLDYCGVSEPAFWEGYGADRPRTPEAEVRRVFYLLYELQKYIFIRRVRRNAPREGERYRRQALALARTLE
jgi:aminoglycoside phosphotransferase (APT) family kinase protein